MDIKNALERKDIKYLIRYIRSVLNLLKSKDRLEREVGWKAIDFLIETGNVNELVQYRNYLRSLLWHRLQGVRDDAWKHLHVYKILQTKGIERALTAQSDKIKWSAWSNVLNLVQLGMVPKEHIRSVRYAYWRLLRSIYPTIRKKAWRLFVKLVHEGIFDSSDKHRFSELLKSNKANVRILAWRTAFMLVKENFISVDELKANIGYLEELTMQQSKVKKVAEKLIKDLT
ncbi:hypothetical protein [Saccharolobus islandicus]|uniref:HEAT repeat domain-containing protein n=1 Tax=Saccharolobus islandicus LAL14/1 TaxID=1241935 RepID=M9U8W2_SACIS|nr:hypothetical protein [Sulfolobus islandicus]AGJ62548.1 Hypothetical Protein SiL_1098 [Sulfolobus islandicus LAL14/1]